VSLVKTSVVRFIRTTIIVLLIVFVILIFADKSVTSNTAAMDFPEPLKRDGCLVLTYHRVRDDNFVTKMVEVLTNSDELKNYSIYKSEFEHHMQVLMENNATFVTADELRQFRESGSFPENCILICFDDVDESVYENAFPILQKYQIPFTLFLIAGHVGNSDFNNLTLANWQQIQEMVDSGLATVGSHTFDMHYLKNDEPVFFGPGERDNFLNDIIKSKQVIEANLSGVEVVDFAYPFGEGKEELVPLIEKAGFLSSYILAPRIVCKDNSPYWQNRILVDNEVFKNIVEPWVKTQS